ncbi:DUF3797 domain-containing protein [Bacillus toyonensis]|uniref:DUF3797 domain-containing protein n=1 Tax=Bacillus toyonensis TaxID=155322 RepID=A0A2A8H903_9BACI|nr:DUF3797 domain-containing protein [Bacillus toyonensis]PEP96677.1 DUF3797 domain-containing protein [Bacillus toyonensis]
MDAWKALEMASEYGKCKQCGNEMIGEGEGMLKIDADIFKQTCKCGWSVEIEEN